MPRVDWYFDFLSPFSYLQLFQLDALTGLAGLHYRPVVFAGLLKHWGQLGPAEIPAKRRSVYRAVIWQARQRNLPLRFPPRHPFNPLPTLRLAIALGSGRAVIEHIFRFIWEEGRDVEDPEQWQRLALQLGVANADAVIAAPAVKAQLLKNGTDAIAHGVFGVPTAVVGGQLFWGDDSTSMLEAFLREPQLFDDPEFRRVDELPYGTTRR